MRFDIAPQDGVDARLIAAPLGFEPVQNVVVEFWADRYLDRLASFSARPFLVAHRRALDVVLGDALNLGRAQSVEARLIGLIAQRRQGFVVIAKVESAVNQHGADNLRAFHSVFAPSRWPCAPK